MLCNEPPPLNRRCKRYWLLVCFRPGPGGSGGPQEAPTKPSVGSPRVSGGLPEAPRTSDKPQQQTYKPKGISLSNEAEAPRGRLRRTEFCRKPKRVCRSIRDRTRTLAPVSLAELFITEIVIVCFVTGIFHYSLITEIFTKPV